MKAPVNAASWGESAHNPGRIRVRRRWSARPFRKLDAGCDHDRPDNPGDRPTHPGHDTSVSDQPLITRPDPVEKPPDRSDTR